MQTGGVMLMGTIINGQTLSELREAAFLQLQRDRLPVRLAETIVPVVELNPKLLRRVTHVLTANRTSTGTTTMRNATPDREFYITSAVISVQGTAATATLDCGLACTVNGSTGDIIAFGQDATAGAVPGREIFLSFAHPIKIDINTAISFRCTYTAGAVNGRCQVHGYEVSNSSG
jgi:hypothetical protein